jgi:hypothetical protein
VHDLSLYLLELLENSIRAGATRVSVEFHADRESDRLGLIVADNGSGLKEKPKIVFNPFYTTKKGKKTGLGLSLLKAEAELAGGYMTIETLPGAGGVVVRAEMRLSHVDRPPIGDIATTITLMEATNPDVGFTVTLTGDEFEPPLTETTLAEAREPLTCVIERLERQAADALTTIGPKKSPTLPVPGAAPKRTRARRFSA